MPQRARTSARRRNPRSLLQTLFYPAPPQDREAANMAGGLAPVLGRSRAAANAEIVRNARRFFCSALGYLLAGDLLDFGVSKARGLTIAGLPGCGRRL